MVKALAVCTPNPYIGIYKVITAASIHYRANASLASPSSGSG